MNHPFQDRRASKLLSRVREDISHLREDVANLFQHTTRHTLPHGARELADSARDRLAAGGQYAASRLRSLGGSPQRQTIGILGGAIVVGVIAAGIYALVSCDRAKCAAREDEEEDEE